MIAGPSSLLPDFRLIPKDICQGLRELAGGHVFITGGTGFVGKWLTLALHYARKEFGVCYQATLLTRDPIRALESAPWLADPSVTLLSGDIRTIRNAPLSGISHVIHAAGDISKTAGALAPLDIAMRGSLELVEHPAIRSARRFLLISSGAVYGTAPCPITGITEATRSVIAPLDLNGAYAQAKIASESICSMARIQGFIPNLSIARMFSACGPFLPADGGFAFADLIRDAGTPGGLVIRGDGTAVRSYLYGADLALWLWSILLRGNDQTAYNVGSGAGVSIRDLAERIAQIHPTQPAISILGRPNDGRAASIYFPDITAAGQLGLAAWTNLDRAISTTIHHTLESP